MFFVLIQASEVLAIFYDVMALQFVQQIDDVAFQLSTLDMLGKLLYRATTAKSYRAQFNKEKGGKRMRIFLKAVYFVNLAAFLSCMAVVSVRQDSGYYTCDEVTVDLGNHIWEDAVVITSNETKVLVYSYFNGVYKQDGSFNNRPQYKELRKIDQNPYERNLPMVIQYCKAESAWVFTHPNIRKSQSSDSEEVSKSSVFQSLLTNQ